MEPSRLFNLMGPSLHQRDFRDSLASIGWSQDLVEGVAKVLKFFETDETGGDAEKLRLINLGLSTALEECARFMEESINQARKAHQEILEVQNSDKEVKHGMES